MLQVLPGRALTGLPSWLVDRTATLLLCLSNLYPAPCKAIGLGDEDPVPATLFNLTYLLNAVKLWVGAGREAFCRAHTLVPGTTLPTPICTPPAES